MHSPIAATALPEPIPRQPTPPKAAARFAARAFCVRFRLPTRTVRKPLAVVALATIEPSRTGEKRGIDHSNRWRCPSGRFRDVRFAPQADRLAWETAEVGPVAAGAAVTW